jgi:hypothetical protein
VYGGTFLTDQEMDKVLVTNLDGNEPFEAAYSGQTVAVYGNILTKVTLYAPQAEHLTLNGVPLVFYSKGNCSLRRLWSEFCQNGDSVRLTNAHEH